MRMLRLTKAGLEVMAPRAHFAGPPKPDGIPRRTWQSLFSQRTSTTTRLTAALACLQLLCSADPGHRLHTTLDVAGLAAARQEINAWAGWAGGPGAGPEGNQQLGIENEDDPVEVVGLDEGIALQFEQAARAAGYGLIEFLISCGMAEIERRK